MAVNDLSTIGDFINQKFTEAFFDVVSEKKRVAEAALLERFRGFFKDIAAQIGANETPALVAEMGVHWEPITKKWAQQKYGKSVPGKNTFYRGLTYAYRRSMRGRNPVAAYGKPLVEIIVGGRIGAPIKGTGDEEVRLRLDAFPKVDEMEDLANGFRDKMLIKLSANEDWGGGVIPNPRPLLGPMYSYYLTRVLPQILSEAVS